MSLGIDPVVASLLFSLGLIPHASKLRAGAESSSTSPVMPFLTVIVALYREKWEDIEMTLLSLSRQTYPREKYEVLLVVEADDSKVRSYAQVGISRLTEAGICARVVVNDGTRCLKASALNRAIHEANGTICAFYDASDDIQESQLQDAVSLMEERNYDVVQSIVLRNGKSFLSRLLLIDTVFWFGKYLPFLLGCAQGVPLSGEGLFVRKSVLDEVGGFPAVLTEDAYLGIILSERNKRFGLVSSVITEKAPRNIKAHFVQRLRWNRGYLTCLVRLLRGQLSVKRKLVLMIPFLAPVSSSLAFWGWFWIGAHTAVVMSSPQPLQGSLYTQFITYWSAMLLVVGIPLCVTSYAHTLWAAGKKRSIPFVMLLPFYWTFLGFCASCSFFKSTKHWGRTER
jgi:cellulose synthase/poly-beta-1,6-N-acetylglucosamine synthase-like glycosyltransferase